MFAFTTADDVTSFDVYDLAPPARARVAGAGLLVPQEPRGPQRAVRRRADGNVDLLELLVDDIDRLLPELHKQSGPLEARHDTFHH